MKSFDILTPDGTLQAASAPLLLSYAAFPDDDVKREAFAYTLLAQEIVDAAREAGQESEVTISTEFLSILLEAPKVSEIQEEAGRALDRGTIAGQLALYAVAAAKGRPGTKLSIEKVIFLMESLSAEAEVPDQRRLPGERTIWDCWSRFKSVSHVLAFLAFFGDQSESERPFDAALAQFLENPLGVLNLAEGIRLSLEEIGLVNAGDLFAAPEELELKVQPLDLGQFPEEFHHYLL